jgi:hypothetical protein
VLRQDSAELNRKARGEFSDEPEYVTPAEGSGKSPGSGEAAGTSRAIPRQPRISADTRLLRESFARA